MTKIRKPLTFENALTTVASHIGWKETARIVGRSENTVRNWSDNDIGTGIPLEAALHARRRIPQGRRRRRAVLQLLRDPR
jgi:hypothetical protein